jgi:cellobiose phosphorylase
LQAGRGDERHACEQVAHGWAPIASHCIRREMAPGESADFVFVLGIAKAPGITSLRRRCYQQAGRQAAAGAFRTAEQFEAGLAELKAYWQALLSRFTIRTDDEKLNRQVNVWNQYQCMVTFNIPPQPAILKAASAAAWLKGLQPGPVRLCAPDPRARQGAHTGHRGTQFPTAAPTTSTAADQRGNLEVGSGFNDDPLWLVLRGAGLH